MVNTEYRCPQNMFKRKKNSSEWVDVFRGGFLSLYNGKDFHSVRSISFSQGIWLYFLLSALAQSSKALLNRKTGISTDPGSMPPWVLYTVKPEGPLSSSSRSWTCGQETGYSEIPAGSAIGPILTTTESFQIHTSVSQLLAQPEHCLIGRIRRMNWSGLPRVMWQVSVWARLDTSQTLWSLAVALNGSFITESRAINELSPGAAASKLP